MFCLGLSSNKCVSFCSTSVQDVSFDFKICQKSLLADCKSLKFQGVSDHFSKTNMCISAGQILDCFSPTNPPGVFRNIDALYVIFYVLTWVMAVFALAGNAATICNTCALLCSRFNIMAKEKKLHNFLLLNLSGADFLMGAYLLTHLILSSSFGTLRQSRDFQIWKFEPICSILGIAGLVSSQVSVTTLVLITTCRLYSVQCPFKGIQIKPIATVAVLSWLVWTLIACIPVIGNKDTFHNTMFVVDRCPGLLYSATYNQWTDKLGKILNKQNCSSILPKTRSWTKLKSIIDELELFNRSKLKTYGYYSDTEFCCTNFYHSKQNPAIGFLLQMVLFNLVAFLYMAVAYCCILRKTVGFHAGLLRLKCCNFCECFRCVSPNENRRKQENEQMYRRIFFVILTDFACWVPISLTIITRTISEEAVSWNATGYITGFMLPLNSALNPFLYANLRRRFWTKSCFSAKGNEPNNVLN